MNQKPTPRRFSRRDVLRLGSQGAIAALAGVALPSAGQRVIRASAPPVARAAQAAKKYMHLIATDGFVNLPGRDNPNDLYVFGFREVGINAQIGDLDVYKGRVQNPAPIIGLNENDEFYLTLTNIGFANRPDLDDSHTVHWHGFRNPVTLFDGVPEVSIAVPALRSFRYFYRAQAPGTYMYHCHFEDSEHVQMGMTGIAFIRPAQNGTSYLDPLGSGKTFTKFVFNDGDGHTGYEREISFMLNEIDTRPHDGSIGVQEFVWSNYKPDYWVMNGRSYPDTVLDDIDGSIPSQPISSRIDVNEGERMLMRISSLGYEQHSLILPGIPMRVVGEDATLLRGLTGADLSYWTNTIYIGPGEARDVIFDAPAHSGGVGPDVYVLRNHSAQKLTNGGAAGPGGMQTEVRVYPAGTLAAQTSYP